MRNALAMTAMTGIGMILILGSGLLLGVAYEWSLWGLAGIICAGLGGLLIGLSAFGNRQKRGNMNRPKIIYLCGSTRFTHEMLTIQWELTKQGYIVLSWCALPDSYYGEREKAHIGDQEGVKEAVDEVHLGKIDLADTVYILNVNGYIGDSTTKEIKYAESVGKPVVYLES